jgi:hypothetical protein
VLVADNLAICERNTTLMKPVKTCFVTIQRLPNIHNPNYIRCVTHVTGDVVTCRGYYCSHEHNYKDFENFIMLHIIIRKEGNREKIITGKKNNS